MYTHTDALGQPIKVGDRIISIYYNDFWSQSTVYKLTECYVKHKSKMIDTKSLPSKCIVINHTVDLKDIDISSSELMNAIAKVYPEKLI